MSEALPCIQQRRGPATRWEANQRMTTYCETVAVEVRRCASAPTSAHSAAADNRARSVQSFLSSDGGVGFLRRHRPSGRRGRRVRTTGRALCGVISMSAWVAPV